MLKIDLKRTKIKYVRNEKSEILFGSKWEESLEEINSYKDLLAPELLAIWEVTEGLVPPTTAVPLQKVLNWLETSEVANTLTQSTMPSQEIEVLPTPIATQELMSVSQLQDVAFVETDSFQQMFLPKLKTKTKSKEVKKRKYIPGF